MPGWEREIWMIFSRRPNHPHVTYLLLTNPEMGISKYTGALEGKAIRIFSSLSQQHPAVVVAFPADSQQETNNFLNIEIITVFLCGLDGMRIGFSILKSSFHGEMPEINI